MALCCCEIGSNASAFAIADTNEMIVPAVCTEAIRISGTVPMMAPATISPAINKSKFKGAPGIEGNWPASTGVTKKAMVSAIVRRARIFNLVPPNPGMIKRAVPTRENTIMNAKILRVSISSSMN